MIRALALALVLAGGCAASRGPFDAGLATPTPDSVAIVVVGGAGARGPAEQDTAEAITQVVTQARTAERDAVVLLVGDWAPHRRARARRARTAGPAPVTAAAWSAGARVGTRFAVRGAAERHHPQAIATPTAHALVRIGADGRGHTLSQCDAARCGLEPAEPGLVDLLLLDLEPWRHPDRGADAHMRRVESLLEAVAAAPATTPRVLVLSLPVEGAYEHGLGAQLHPDAIFHVLPPMLQQRLADGTFVGVLAGGERSTYFTADLTAAIQRSDHVWLRAPLWQVVSGNAADPLPGRAARRALWRRGVAYRPEVSSDRPGFAVLRVDGSPTAVVDVIARRRGRWTTARSRVPLRPAPHPAVGPVPGMSPCLRCEAAPAGEHP